MNSTMSTARPSGREATSMPSNKKCVTDQSPRQPELKRVIIPDLFVSFISQKPKLNPHYEVMKKESETWMKQICHWTEAEHTKHVRADFPYLAAVFAEQAGPDELRTIIDWTNWVFDFDDIIDHGELNKHPENARKEVEALLELMKSPNPIIYTAEQDPLRHVFQSVWQRFEQRSSHGARRRYIKAHEGFFSSLIDQVDMRSSASKPDIETYMAGRRDTIGVYPCLALAEYFYALDIPDEVFEHHSIREIEILACDIVALQNDVLSFHKEQFMDFNHNIIQLFRQDGHSEQEAYDQVSQLLNKRYRAWYLSLAELPSWGEAVDVQVQMYIKGCQDMILANLNWSFKSERYFGKENMVVRKTRMVTMLPE